MHDGSSASRDTRIAGAPWSTSALACVALSSRRLARPCADVEIRSSDTMPNALITGITGQDGSYLAELLLDKGYNVFGVIRRVSRLNDERIRHLEGRIHLIEADLLDQLSLVQALRISHADEV